MDSSADRYMSSRDQKGYGYQRKLLTRVGQFIPRGRNRLRPTYFIDSTILARIHWHPGLNGGDLLGFLRHKAEKINAKMCGGIQQRPGFK